MVGWRRNVQAVILIVFACLVGGLVGIVGSTLLRAIILCGGFCFGG